MKNCKKIISLFLLCLIAVACAKSENTQVAQTPQYYPQCHEPLEYLQNRGSTTRAVATGALQGSAITGISTLIIGAITGRLDPTGVIASVGAGAVVGGTLGGVSQGSKEDTRQMHAYLEKIDGDISNINTIENAAGAVANQCYRKAFTTLLDGMKTGKIDAAAADARFNEILAGVNEAGKYYDSGENTAVMQKQFSEALKQD